MCYICYRYVQNRGCLTSSDQISILNRKTLAQSDKWHHMELIFYLIRLANHTRKKNHFAWLFGICVPLMLIFHIYNYRYQYKSVADN